MESSEYVVEETDRRVSVCAILNGTTEEDVIVSLTTTEGTAEGEHSI